MKYRIGLAAVAASVAVAFAFTPASVYAEEGAGESVETLEAIEETSQEAVVAPSDEEAKDLSGQGFDTPISGN